MCMYSVHVFMGVTRAKLICKWLWVKFSWFFLNHKNHENLTPRKLLTIQYHAGVIRH